MDGTTITLDDENVMVYADRDKMVQAICNLIKNACEAMPAGGCLSIKTDICRLGENDQPAVAVVIADSGSGIPEDVARYRGTVGPSETRSGARPGRLGKGTTPTPPERRP